MVCGPSPRISGGSPGVDALHPADQHLGVEAVDVHPRAVHVEVAQRDVVQAVHGVEAAQHALVERLGRAVEGVVVVRVVALGGRELLGQPVHRRRRRGDHLAAPRASAAASSDVEGAVDQHLVGQPRLLGALGDADRGEVEDQVGARRSARAPGRGRGCRPRRRQPAPARQRPRRGSSRRPRTKLSSTTISRRRPSTSRSTTCEPMVPAPPVTRTRWPSTGCAALTAAAPSQWR